MGQINGSGPSPLGRRVVLSSNFTRPSDTTTYANFDLVANSTTAGSVVPLSWAAARIAGGGGLVRRVTIRKSGAVLTLAAFSLHLYTNAPTCTNGDNGAWLTTMSGWLGRSTSSTMAQAFSDGAASTHEFTDTAGQLFNGGCPFQLASGQTLYGLLQVSAAYVPVSAEVFTVDLDIEQD